MNHVGVSICGLRPQSAPRAPQAASRAILTEAKVGRGMPWAAPLLHMLPQRIVMEALLTPVYLCTETGRSESLDAAHRLFEPVYRSADAQEGPRAFAEKRPPLSATP